MKKINASSTKPEITAYVSETFGVELPDSMTKAEMFEEANKLMKENGIATFDTDAPSKPESSANGKAERSIKGYVIQIEKPADTSFEEFVCCANGRNYQVKYGEPVKVPPIVVELLKLAVIDVPDYKTPDGKLVPAHKKSRFVWGIRETIYAE
ncbi:hypothetical protein [Rheinheimera sp. MMS21-TC3]|uniref:hypothetical protein n=1 Tax=Rheinheimera sp. MMS21-TC3 TaxID=3072790 RepID=UPI0028C3FC6A|nr:hypothetical protein [Rheinheimera sp. MMS21-TC3]WNO60442.1 hypothetical protein RDV63_05610 [Rheinheimera sp. MMS21-TC3]